jgi:uncharacterized damage-inducible protein DinB
MPEPMKRILEPAAGIPSRALGLFLAQLNDQTRRLTEDTRSITPAELAWQPAPGMNTIGMLLAHIATVEVGWIQVGARDFKTWEVERVLEKPYAEFGMPLKEDGAPPTLLAGRDLAYYDSLLARARDYTREALMPFTDADLDRRFQIVRGNGQPFEGNLGWVLYHVLEHFAGHYGQVLVLRHQYELESQKA